MKAGVKNNPDGLFFYTRICAGATNLNRRWEAGLLSGCLCSAVSALKRSVMEDFYVSFYSES